MTKLRSINRFTTNKVGLSDTSLGLNKINIAKRVLLVESKDPKWLSGPLQKIEDMYSLGTSIPNKLGIFLTILDSMSSRF